MRHLINRIRWEWWFYRGTWSLPLPGTCDLTTFEICLDRMMKTEPKSGRPADVPGDDPLGIQISRLFDSDSER